MDCGSHAFISRRITLRSMKCIRYEFPVDRGWKKASARFMLTGTLLSHRRRQKDGCHIWGWKRWHCVSVIFLYVTKPAIFFKSSRKTWQSIFAWLHFRWKSTHDCKRRYVSPAVFYWENLPGFSIWHSRCESMGRFLHHNVI